MNASALPTRRTNTNEKKLLLLFKLTLVCVLALATRGSTAVQPSEHVNNHRAQLGLGLTHE